eukprot:760745-Prymnesium_polylepis.1
MESKLQSVANVEHDPGFKAFSDLLLADDTREEVDAQYIKPLTREGSSAHAGLLLMGPPGTGKTVLAKAIAAATGAHFLPITTADVLSQWQGKADKAMKAIVSVARANAPCIIFFDECEKLLKSATSPNDPSVANEFKANVDPSVLSKERVLIVCATNHIAQLEPAVIDRFGTSNILELPPLSVEQRATLMERELPSNHQLDHKDIVQLVGQLGGDGLRILKQTARAAINLAEDRGGRGAPVTADDLTKALARAERGEALLRKARAAAEAPASDLPSQMCV